MRERGTDPRQKHRDGDVSVNDLSVGRNVPERFRCQLLSFEDFAVTWQRWGEQDIQAEWRDRLEEGYARQADEFTERIKAALMRVDAGSSSVGLSDAA